MPLYEYKCQKCGDVFEVMQKFSDEPLSVHERGCGGSVVRLLAAPALQFKGSGWYITDYAKGANSKPAGKNGESAPAKDNSSSEPSKSTPAAAATTASADKK